jgi:Spy/CpxP family protein refolding chaperone
MNRKLKVSLFILGIFACGVVVGAFGARRLAPPMRGPIGAEGFGPQVMRRLTDELGLSDAQRAEIEPVIKQAGEQLRELRRESVRQSGAVIEGMDAAISARLTEEQRAKFVVLKEAQRARMRVIMEERQRRRAEGERERVPRGGAPAEAP